MQNNIIRRLGAGVLLALWLGLAVFAWLKPADLLSESERRPLEQFPAISLDAILSGAFMADFEEYTLDQFPARDAFRQVKSMFHYYMLNQRDNNGIYLANGYAAKLEYPLNENSLQYALDKFSFLYSRYLRPGRCNVYMAVVPDKGYYLAESNGYPAMDYDALFSTVREAMPWAKHIDLTELLSVEDYYFTDTHWRQERLIPVAQAIARAMGVTGPEAEDFTAVRVDRPFYGVYYGQAALPLPSEDLFILNSPVLSNSRVYNHESGAYTSVYDEGKLASTDLYDIFLSGAQPLLTIENPNAATDKELIVFRDSFGSSLVPLLVQDYARVTLVDIRYINSQFLSGYVDFAGKDVLFLYSTLVLNSSSALR